MKGKIKVYLQYNRKSKEIIGGKNKAKLIDAVKDSDAFRDWKTVTQWMRKLPFGMRMNKRKKYIQK